MEANQTQTLKKYLDLLLRHIVIIILAFFCSGLLGLGAYLYMPKVYQATSLLSYQQQRVNPNEMSPDIEARRVDDMVSTLSQIITSRTNLEKLVISQKLYEKAREDLPMEDVVDSMRKKIFIQPSKKGDTFVISYMGIDPEKVVRVTNSLASNFVEENLKYREERATETSAYTRDELQLAKEVLDEKEASMRDYKMKFYNEMPDQRETNVQQLISMQEQYQNRQVNIQELERTKILVQEQINVRQNAIASEKAALLMEQNDNEKNISGGSPIKSLEMAKAQLERLLLKYTERHPDVKRLKKIIKGLEKEFAHQSDSSNSSINSNSSSHDTTLSTLKIQLKEIRLNITALNNEKKALKKNIEQLEKWISSSPVREAEWSALTREYGELKRHYDYLVSQNLQAKSVLHLERRQKGSQFKIEDPARYPEKPFKPDFFKIVGLLLVAGVGLAAGFVLLRDFLDNSFRVGTEMEKHLGLPVICTLPYIETKNEIIKRRVFSLLSTLLITCVGVGVCGAYVYCWMEGMIII